MRSCGGASAKNEHRARSPMTQRGESIELHLAEEAGLRTTFVWRDDRYAHVVALVAPDGAHTLFESVEGGPDDPWPPSPALQHLSMQGQGDQRVALLVGMAGKSHWSMSVEVAASGRGIVFDVACRINESAATLGSSYLSQGHALADPRTATGQLDASRYALVLDPDLPPDCQSLETSTDRVRVRCLPPRSTMPYTARWKYLVTLC